MGDLILGEIAYKPACRFYKKPPQACRHLKVQDKIFRNPTDVTTRLAERIPGQVRMDALRKNVADMVKGLFILPAINQVEEEGHSFLSCWGRLPLIVFGRPSIQGQKADYQHIDLARQLALTWHRRLTAFESKHFHDGRIWGEEELQSGVWGFVLAPLSFKADSSLKETRVVDPKGEASYWQEIRVNAQLERGLVNARSGAIDLEKVKGIELPTAKALHERGICAYLMRATRKKDPEVWGVYAKSGAGGAIPDLAIPIFLQALAHHVAPEFMLFQFITNGKDFFYPHAIKPFWREAVYPNCLKWPLRMRMLKRNQPPKWWWGQ